MIDTETDDDELYFTSASSSNLASLFNTTMLPFSQDKDASLTYKPLKQPNVNPNQNVNTTRAKYENSVIIFKEVFAFQIVNTEHRQLGKCGFAVVGNEIINIYQLLLYKNRENIISSTKPTPSLEIIIKSSNHITYKDDKNLQWLLHFHTETDLNDFTTILNMKCQCKLSKQIVSNTVKEDKTNGSEITEKNTSKEDIFNHSEHTETETDISLQNILPSKVTPHKLEKPDVKPKSLSIKTETQMQNVLKNVDSDNSDSSEATKKADILNRVAKMGKKLIDKEPDITDSSDIEEKITRTDLKLKKGKLSKHNVNEKIHINHPIDSVIQRTIPNQYTVMNTQMMVPYQENKELLTDQFNILYLENKNTTNEIKMNMIKLQNDVGEVLRVIKRGETDTRNISTQTDGENLIEENQKLLLQITQQNELIQKLKEDNEKLKNKNESLMTKATENAYEIASLTEKNAKSISEKQFLIMKMNEEEKELDTLRSKVSSNSLLDDQLVKKSVLTECEMKIKQQMNKFYRETCEKFVEDEQYDGKTIKKQLTQTIIDNTYAVLKTLKETFTDT